MELEPDEDCCVCYENMKKDQNLTYCKIGCGRNIHIDCIEVWVKHKVSVGQKITCPVRIIQSIANLLTVFSCAELIGALTHSKI